MPRRVKVTACDEPSGSRGHDLLVFPDGVRYRGVQEADLPNLIEDHLIGNRVSGKFAHEPISETYVFVCVHGSRDLRCKVCGVPLIEEFVSVLEQQGLADAVKVHGASHVGGHRFAGNVLIYPDGNWYGYVTSRDVRRIVEQHIEKGDIVTDLWRGRMGLTPEEQLKQVEMWQA
jgi:(2Fe-2S) ferredoxin